MPIDLVQLQSLSKEQVENLQAQKNRDVTEFRKNLTLADNRINEALADKSIKVADLGLLISLKTEKSQELDNANKDLQLITGFVEGKVVISESAAIPNYGGGGVNIRADDTKNQPVKGAQTYGEWMEAEAKKKAVQDKKTDPTLSEVLNKLENLTTIVDNLAKGSKSGWSASTETSIQTS